MPVSGRAAPVGEAEDGRGALPAVDRHHPDVVLMDIRMPRLDGIAATSLVRAQPRPPEVIVLTTFDADQLVLRALQAGAAGSLYLSQATVKAHVSRLLVKLGVTNRVQIALLVPSTAGPR